MTASPKLLPFRLPPPAGGPVDLLVIAGEHSGDEHAARMVQDLRARQPGLTVAALGGPGLAAAGAQLLYDLTAPSVVGLLEVLRHYSFFKALFAETLRWIEEHRPRAVCFVDYPGLNLRLAAALRERGLSVQGGGPIKLLYYISPQIWAWKAGRRHTMARDLDALAVIFPFETACYADTRLPVEFVGHPFLAAGYRAPVAFDPTGPILLLPGSRTQAVARIYPDLLAAFARYRTEGGDREAVVIYPSDEVGAVLRRWEPAHCRLARTGEPIAAAAVLTSSGTMSLHCALAGIPGAIAYRTNLITYLLARWWVKLDYIGIANLLLKEPMYPEFIQGAARPTVLAAQLQDCLDQPARRARTTAQQVRLRALLDHPADVDVAGWLLRHL